MNQSSTEEDIEKVKEKAIQQGHEPLVIYGVERNVVAVSGKVNDDHRAVMKLLPNVSRVIPVGKPYKLASRNYQKDDSVIAIKNLSIGGQQLAIIAGPDSAETQEQTIESLQNDMALQGQSLLDLQKKNNEIQGEMNRYLDIFKRHNLTKLAAAKPGLIETRVNKATKEVFDGIEQDSRDIDMLDDGVQLQSDSK